MENKEIVDGLKIIGDKMDLQKKEGKDAVDGVSGKVEALAVEAKKLIADVEKKFEDQVKQVNDEMAKEGKSLREIAEAVDNLKKKQGRMSPIGGNGERDASDVLREFITDNYTQIKGLNKQNSLSFEIKAGNVTISNVTSTGSAINSPYSYMPGYITRPTRKTNIRDLVPVISSATGAFVYYRQSPGSVGAGSFGFQAGQGNVKSALDYNVQQVILPLDYLAGTARIAKQMIDDMPQFLDFVSSQLLEDYRRSESAAFIPTLLSSSTQYTPAATVTAEKIIQAIGDLYGKDWAPSGIITDASTWSKIMNTKPDNYSLPGGGAAVAIDADGNVRFVGLPMVVQNNIGSGNVIVGDFTKAAIIQCAGLQLGFFEQDQDNVVRNLVTARVEARVGLAVFRTDAFDTFTAGAT